MKVIKLNKIKLLDPKKVTLKVTQSVNIEKKPAAVSTWDNLEEPSDNVFDLAEDLDEEKTL